MAVVSKLGPLASPKFFLWCVVRGLRAFIRAPRLDKRSVFVSKFGKKIKRISSEDPFFSGLQLHLARCKRSEILKLPGSAQCKCGPEKNYPAHAKSSILTRLLPGCRQRLRTNDSNLTKPGFEKRTED